MSEFTRPVQENYGPSTVRLEKLDMTKGYGTVTVNGIEVILPLLNVKKYDADSECYAFIEQLTTGQIAMVDVLYTYKDIEDKFEHDPNFRRSFLNFFERKQINSTNIVSPVLTMTPRRENTAILFSNAVREAVQDGVGRQLHVVSRRTEEDFDIEIPKDPNSVKEDGLILEFIKDFYEIISRTKVKRPTDPEKRTVTYTMSKEAILMKSGATIFGNEEIPRFFANFRTEISSDEIQNAKDSLAIHISGIDQERLMTSPEYFQYFTGVLLESNVLEAFAYANGERVPKLVFAGKYNEEEERMEVDRKNERRFNEINGKLIPTKSDDGR